jgi:hypothetical protein
VLHGGEVRLLGIMHMEADLLDNIDDVGAGERQVLEGPSKATKHDDEFHIFKLSNNRFISPSIFG